jgi:DNA adenine methylase
MPDVLTRPALTPPLKWAGGKRWQVPHLRPLWAPHSHRRLVEPFCGGLAVSLGLMPDRALLNDTNPHLVSFYRWLKKGLTIEIPMKNDRTRFYECRDRFNDLLVGGQGGTLEAASLFYYLNRTGYNGLCRFNQQGEFNVPFGRYKRIGYRSDFTEYRDVLSAWEITNDDVESFHFGPTTSSTRIRRTTSSSRSTHREGSRGRTRNARPSFSRSIRDR